MTTTIERLRIARPMSPGAAWSRRLGVFSTVLLVTVVLAHRFRLVSTPDLEPLLGTVLVLALAGLAGGVAAHRRYWYFGDRGGPDIFWGIVWSLVTIAPFLVAAWWYLAYPKLVDISTDLENPPSLAMDARLRTPDMNAVGEPTPETVIEQVDAYPLVESHRYELPMDRVLAAVEQIAAGRGWRLMATREAVGLAFETTIEFLVRSPVWGIPADVSIRVSDKGAATFVDMRSASRYGAHDLGANAARITGFLAELDGMMLVQGVSAPARSSPAGEGDAPTVEIPDTAPPPTQAPLQ